MRLPDKNIQSGKYWTHGITLVEGCTKVSPGCQNCWALAMYDRFSGAGFSEVRFHKERLEKLTTTDQAKPRVYSIWNDLFHENVPFVSIDKVFSAMWESPQHVYMVLTKRPERLFEYSKRKGKTYRQKERPTIFIGVTAENQEMADLRFVHLMSTRSLYHFVSLEPLLGPISLSLCAEHDIIDFEEDSPVACVPCCKGKHWKYMGEVKNCLDWVIVGAETGPNRRPCKLEWIESIVCQCREAGVPVWVKVVEVNGKLIKNFNDLPESVRFREYPFVKEQL